jgi:hypothetical protein
LVYNLPSGQREFISDERSCSQFANYVIEDSVRKTRICSVKFHLRYA